MKEAIYSITILCILSTFSCTKKRGELLISPTETINVSICDSLNVTYTNSAKAIIDVTCAVAGCHVNGGSAPTDYTTYSGVMVSVNFGDAFRDRVFVVKDMPPTGGSQQLTTSDLQKLECWLNKGAPQ